MNLDINSGSNRSYSSFQSQEESAQPNSNHNSFSIHIQPSSSPLGGTSFPSDFIVICQPSELEGPLPILVLPDTPKSKFNIGKFAVRLHSIEYTAKYPISEAYNEFVPKDVQVVLTEPGEKAIAFVYHFGLHDYVARGYTRFFSISYITRVADSKKIMNHFETLTQQFEKVVSIYRTTNKQYFARELETRKADLEFTKQYLKEHQKDEEIDQSNTHEESNDPFEQSNKPPTSKKCDFALKELEDIFERFKSANSEFPHLFSNQKDTNYTPKLLNNLNRDTYIDLQIPLRGLNEICSETAHNKAIKQMKKILKHFSRPSIVLSLEEDDYSVLEPISSLLTVGHIVMNNFHPNANRISKKGKDKNSNKNNSNRSIFKGPKNNNFKDFKENLSDNQEDISENQEIVSENQENTSENQEIISENQEIVSENQKNENQQNAAFHSVSHSREKIDRSSSDDDSMEYHTPSTPEDSSKILEPKLIAQKLEQYKRKTTFVVPVNKDEIELQSNSSFSSSYGSLSTGSLNMLSHSFPIHCLNRKNFRLESFAASLWGYSKNKWGIGFLELREKYVFLKHLLFSILKGRPVVIFAKQNREADVRKFIQSCAIFIPGQMRKTPSILPWLTRPLKMSDLACTKLVGYSKNYQIPKSIERYVSIFDFDNETLRSPFFYGGKFVEDIICLKKIWPDEDTYLAYVHTVLYNLGIYACLYYHLCCIGIPEQLSNQEKSLNSNNNNNNNNNKSQNEIQNSNNNNLLQKENRSYSLNKSMDRPSYHLENQRNSMKRSMSLESNLLPNFGPIPSHKTREESKSQFFKRLGLTKQDVEIVEYFAEVVKEQQTLEMHGIDHLSPVIRLDYSTCQDFKNQRK